MSIQRNKMKAAILKEFHQDLSIEEVDIPQPGYGEILVKVRASGLCATDLHIIDGVFSTVKIGLVPGHEMAGEVYQLGEGVKGWDIGQHVIAAIDVTCGSCRACLRGNTNRCKEMKRIGFEINGAHEEYAIIPQGNLIKISDDIPFEQAAIVPDAVACMYHAIKNIGKVTAGDKVLFLGVGGLGLQGIQIAKAFGAQVYATSRQDKKLELAKQFGADVVINTSRQNLLEEVLTVTNEEQCDVVFDNIGIKNSINESLKLVRPGGKVVAVGYIVPEFTANYQEMVVKEKEILGIRGSTKQDIVESMQMIEKGIIVPYIYKTYHLEEINEALRSLRNGETLGRTVIVFD